MALGDGLTRSGNRFEITYNGRKVTTTDGTLVCLAPSLITFSGLYSFPTFEMDYWYKWEYLTGTFTGGSGTQMNYEGTAQVYFTAVPQEHEDVYNLFRVQAGVDFAVTRVRLTRTKNPATWQGLTPPVLAKTGEWLGWDGSCILEQDDGMVRLLHVVVEDGYLRVVLQQSVSAPPSGWGKHGEQVPKRIGDTGGINSYGIKKGIPVWTSEKFFKTEPVSHYNEGVLIGTYPVPTTKVRRFQIGQLEAVSTKRPKKLSYLSTYQIEIEAQVGRRS